MWQTGCLLIVKRKVTAVVKEGGMKELKKIVISIQNGLLAEAITEMVSYSGEFQPFRIKTGNKKNDVVDSCEMFSADMLLAEVA